MFPSSPDSVARARAAWKAGAVAFAAECRAVTEVFDTAAPEDREFVHGEVGCVFHLSPFSAGHKLGTALAMTARPQLLTALEAGRLGVGQALAVLGEIEHLDAPHAEAGWRSCSGSTTPAPTPRRRSR